MPKSDAVKIAEITSRQEKFVGICDLVKHVLYFLTLLALVICFTMVSIAALKVPDENLNAFAKCLAAMHLNDIVEYITIGIFGCGWYFEHQRCKRLVKKEGDLRHKLESRDPVNSRSGLDETGATPKN